MITDRDRLWVREWFEPYKYATLEMIQKVFLKDRQYSYNIARKRLLELKKEGYIRVDRDSVTNRNVYMLNEKDVRFPSEHKLIILNVLAEMKYSGFNVEHFEVEKHWIHDKGRLVYSDAFAIFTMDNRRYHYFIEVHKSNNVSNLEKYDDLYGIGVVQEFYNGLGIPELRNYYPRRVLLVSDREYSKPIELKYCQVIQLDSKLSNFYKILI